MDIFLFGHVLYDSEAQTPSPVSILLIRLEWDQHKCFEKVSTDCGKPPVFSENHDPKQCKSGRPLGEERL